MCYEVGKPRELACCFCCTLTPLPGPESWTCSVTLELELDVTEDASAGTGRALWVDGETLMLQLTSLSDELWPAACGVSPPEDAASGLLLLGLAPGGCDATPWEGASRVADPPPDVAVLVAAPRAPPAATVSAIVSPPMWPAGQAGADVKGCQAMANRIESGRRAVRLYEQPGNRRRALASVPLARLVKASFEAGKQARGPTCFSDLLLRQLLRWFKREFFKWTNEPPCSTCGSGTRMVGVTAPDQTEALGLAGRTEVYKCKATACQKLTRFPRYNHPATLLDTRCGRCGEWANCFTLLCRAVGLDARHVSDWTDHVWTEVWSPARQRWLHCDSCEDAMDRPLLYEAGWGKKLSFIVAFGPDEVVDVARRYSKKHSELMARRASSGVPELWLKEFIAWASAKQSAAAGVAFGSARQQELRHRHATEEREFLANARGIGAAGSDATELQGRLSGSLAWRVARGETGAAASATGGSGGAGGPAAADAAASRPHSALECGWQEAGSLPFTTGVAVLTSFGSHLVALSRGGKKGPQLAWCSAKALEAAAAGGAATTATKGLPAPWKKLKVAVDGEAWPGRSRRVVGMAATASPMQIFAADAACALWRIVPPSGGKGPWLASRCGDAPPEVSGLATFGGRLVAVAGGRLLLRDSAGSWSGLAEARGIDVVAGGGDLGFALSAQQLLQRLPPAMPREVPGAMIRVSIAGGDAPALVGEAMTVLVAAPDGTPLSGAHVAGRDDWIALMRVGHASEAATLWAPLEECVDGRVRFAGSRSPDSAGLWEFRVFRGWGFDDVVATSAPFVVSERRTTAVSVGASGDTLEIVTEAALQDSGSDPVTELRAQTSDPAAAVDADAVGRVLPATADSPALDVWASSGGGADAALTNVALVDVPLDDLAVASSVQQALALSSDAVALAAASRATAGEGFFHTPAAPPLGVVSLDDAAEGAVTTSGQNGPKEAATKLFDGNVNSKWLEFRLEGAWVAVEVDEELRGRLRDGGLRLVGYALTTANDCPERDPAQWVLQGLPADAPSTDDASWMTLDERTAELPRARKKTQGWLLRQRPMPACRAFRIRIAAVRDPAKATCVQIARLRLYYSVDGVTADFAAAAQPTMCDRVVRFGRRAPGRRWAALCPAVGAVAATATADGCVVVATERGLWRLQVPPGSARLKCSD